ncbi:Para-hydroxybenzoate--polyprenyltransferase, mitochondrial precursor (PHB:polyprenyltransferase) [Epicoccum nigrum]|nr:Para-hydroxybenzoate--polyprenyltransferase, mitochondrial precursor (PHB:polyprenyltransferase) [Epicoccum nigrum]
MASQLLSLAGPASELMRIPKPVGIFSVFFPNLYGFLFVRVVEGDNGHSAQQTLLIQLPILFFSALIVRSAGCVWNDIVDMDLDRLVERTRTRPLPRGAISPAAAQWLAFFLYAIWIGTLRVLLPTTQALFVYGAPLTVLVIAYPYMKRITNYPQIWLGFTLAFGVFLGGTIAGFDIFQFMADANKLDFKLLDGRAYGLMLLHLAYVVFSIIADTIYAFQDCKDDEKAGIKSMALSLSGQTKPALWVLTHAQVILLMLTGMCFSSDMSGRVEGSTSLYVSETGQQPRLSASNTSTAFPLLMAKSFQQRWSFWIIAVLGNAIVLSLMVERVDLSNPADCARWFKMGTFGVGFTIGIGLLLEYVRQVL